MCGRFTLTVAQLGGVAEQVGAWLDPNAAARYRPRYNIAPTDEHWIVCDEQGKRLMVPAVWGRRASGNGAQINSRAETLNAPRRRCAVPADGFYEWRGPARAREPIRFVAADGSILWLAGIYAPAADRPRFSVITTAANAVVAPVHDRMPALLDAAGAAAWLGGGDPRALLLPAPDAWLIGAAASRRVNSIANDDPGLLVADDAPAQLALFAR